MTIDEKQLIALLTNFKDEIIQSVDHRLGIVQEDFQHKLDLVVEGHEVLRGEIQGLGRKTDERFDLVDFKIDTLNQKIDAVDDLLSKKIDAVEDNLSKKIDAVSADLSAHRADTESHHGVYRVKEG